MKVYYFGCESEERKGHFLHNPWQPGYMHMSASREQREELPWNDSDLDGGLAPKNESQPEGICKLHHKDGWTALAWWDRSADGRFNSNSAVIAEGEHNYAEMIDVFSKHFPVVYERVTNGMELKQV